MSTDQIKTYRVYPPDTRGAKLFIVREMESDRWWSVRSVMFKVESWSGVDDRGFFYLEGTGTGMISSEKDFVVSWGRRESSTDGWAPYA